MNKCARGKVGCWAVVQLVFVKLSSREEWHSGTRSVYIDPAWTTPHRPASYFHRYKLVFHLRVTITIKGETQMGSVSN